MNRFKELNEKELALLQEAGYIVEINKDYSDLGYIKACVDRVEKNLNKVDERYKDVLERLAKVEEGLLNVTKRVDEVYQLE